MRSNRLSYSPRAASSVPGRLRAPSRESTPESAFVVVLDDRYLEPTDELGEEVVERGGEHREHDEDADDDQPDERRAPEHLPRQEVELVVAHEVADELLDVVDCPDCRRDPPQHDAGQKHDDQRTHVE